MRWRVKLSEVTGDILPESLAIAGYELDGDMLSGEFFEVLNDWEAVSDLAHDLAHRVREIARLNPEIEVGFYSGAIHEYDADGNEVGVHNKTYEQGALLALRAGVVGVGAVTSSLSPEERAENAPLARATRARDVGPCDGRQ